MISQPVTRIYALEITSVCNLRCHYCPQPKMGRSKEHMSDEVFERALYWLREFQKDGTQNIIHLQQFGESTLHPTFVEMVDRITDIVPEAVVSSNGVGVTREMIRDLRDAGLTKMALSIHRPEVVQKVGQFCLEEGLPYEWASGPLSAPHSFAGQVENVRVSAIAETFPCLFLDGGECIVGSDGRIVTCCIDAEAISATHGTVFDDLRQMSLKPFTLCQTCHHQVPERFGNWRERMVEEITLV